MSFKTKEEEPQVYKLFGRDLRGLDKYGYTKIARRVIGYAIDLWRSHTHFFQDHGFDNLTEFLNDTIWVGNDNEGRKCLFVDTTVLDDAFDEATLYSDSAFENSRFMGDYTCFPL